MAPFESLLVKGILVGIGTAVICASLFFRWIPHAAMSNSLIKRFALNFFGGIGVGYVIVLAVVLGTMYAGWVHSKHIIDAARP
jgi:hypothetical protein